MGTSWIPDRDVNGDFLLRDKVTKSGRVYDQRVIEFSTSKLSSEWSAKYDGTDWGDVSLKFYRADGTEILSPTQATLDTDCIYTAMSWEPTYDYDFLGGELTTLSCPMNYGTMLNARVWVIAVPFLPHPLGEIEMVGGRVIKGHPSSVSADGRAGKAMAYDGVYHTNEIMTYIKTVNPGEQFRLEMVFEHYFERV